MIKCFCYVEAKGLLLSGSADRTIKVWNVLTLNNRDVLTGHRGEVCCLVHMQDSLLNDSVTLVASGGTDQKVIIWNLDLAQIVKQLHGHMDTVTALAYNLEKMHLWSVGADRTVRIWDWFNSKQLKSLKRHGDLISDIKLIKQRELVVTASWDHKIRVTGYEYYYLANN
jgi:F-box/WD-40 domain protein 7